MARQIKLQSGITVEVGKNDNGAVTVRTPYIDEEISPAEAREIAEALTAEAAEA